MVSNSNVTGRIAHRKEKNFVQQLLKPGSFKIYEYDWRQSNEKSDNQQIINSIQFW